MSSIPQIVLEEIEQLKSEGKYDQALRKVNLLLIRDPKNKEALYQVADIEYRRGEISNAEKPVDFLLNRDKNDPMGWYIKGVLEMEKTNRKDAKLHLRKALEMLDGDNPEIMRCYGLCEYRSGNREEGIIFVKKAYNVNPLDAEVILNLIEIAILEKDLQTAKQYIKHFHDNEEKVNCFDRNLSYYQEKVSLFEQYVLNENE